MPISKMKNLTLHPLLTLLAAVFSIGSTYADPINDFSTYQGAWFNIQYPSNFTVRPSLQSRSNADYDSAFFASPDGKVKFYIFSPQWNGDPSSDIAIIPEIEQYEAQQHEIKQAETIRRITIRAKNGSYTRSYVDIENHQTNTRVVFGITYQNQTSYDRYKSDYLKFKQSLIQYSD